MNRCDDDDFIHDYASCVVWEKSLLFAWNQHVCCLETHVVHDVLSARCLRLADDSLTESFVFDECVEHLF